MTYLWINPVSERMISVEALERMLEKHALTRVVCRESWGEIVLRKYRELLEHADGTFADARCPAAVSLVHSLQPEIQIADIEPILITVRENWQNVRISRTVKRSSQLHAGS